MRHKLQRGTVVKKLIVAALVIAGSPVSSMGQDAQKGAAVFNVCLACHTIGPGAQNKIGPELNGLDDRKAGLYIHAAPAWCRRLERYIRIGEIEIAVQQQRANASLDVCLATRRGAIRKSARCGSSLAQFPPLEWTPPDPR